MKFISLNKRLKGFFVIKESLRIVTNNKGEFKWEFTFYLD
ncbi:hypothetical protein BC03BB108_B0038 (plasmid) [Bacillus cereus 03BB108]|nr:hypothetical protein BC03BB108_B0038 [Bacillus cereus 03BB108]